MLTECERGTWGVTVNLCMTEYGTWNHQNKQNGGTSTILVFITERKLFRRARNEYRFRSRVVFVY